MSEERSAESRVVVLGVGNVLLGDEGVGVHVVRELERRQLPKNVRPIDGGTGGFNLISIIAEADRLIVVDTLAADGAPGEVFRFTPEEVRAAKNPVQASLHDVGLLDALELAAVSGYHPETIIFGVIPETIEWGQELSPSVAAAVPKVVGAVLQEIGGLC